MDYILIQATSVPCKCIFSSAKETETAKQNQMSPVLMEALQLMKFMLKKWRLDFIKGWATPTEAMGVHAGGDLKEGKDLLGNLIAHHSPIMMDNILNHFSSYN
jgi:hypothetical protein